MLIVNGCETVSKQETKKVDDKKIANDIVGRLKEPIVIEPEQKKDKLNPQKRR